MDYCSGTRGVCNYFSISWGQAGEQDAEKQGTTIRS